MILIARSRPIIGGSYRVLQGGGWYYCSLSCRSANRDWAGPTDRIDFLGFRVILRKKTP